jgi:2-polyprenyl-6-methoxyphenol hydroxylase-like FAD-dependent oxidoreductase
MRTIHIVGAGQSGLQLALGLQAAGYEVDLVSARTPVDLRTGGVLSTQAMFGPALDTERALGLNLWEDEAPRIAGFHIGLSASPGELTLDFLAPLDACAQSTDQRLKMAAWLELFESRGGTVRYAAAGPADLDAGAYDLTVVAAGRGGLAALFPRDPARSPYTSPQRRLALAYVHGLEPDPAWPVPNVSLTAFPGLGELVVIPALTFSGPCDILFWEGVPGGPLDLGAATLEGILDLARRYAPWVYDRCRHVELTDARATLSGRITPIVRQQVAALPGGGYALGVADAVTVNDPITGQGANLAAKSAAAYLAAVVARGDGPFDRGWMTGTAESFRESTAEPTTEWTNAMLAPLPPHVQRILATAPSSPPVARRFANGFADPADFRDWLLSPDRTTAYLDGLTSERT